jgi:uridine kinase
MTLTRVVDLSRKLSTAIAELSRRHERVVVGIDGPDCAGKTTVADHLAEALRMPTERASVDSFSRPRGQRYERGELSAEGYYLDSFDYPALLNECLLPFLGGESGLRTTAHDHAGDTKEAIDARAGVAARAVLVVDGVFLLRPELRELWTLSVYLRVSPQETLRRAHHRDLALFGSAQEIERRYLGRYLPGQALYRQRADPEAIAHILVDNERTDTPRIQRWSVPAVPVPPMAAVARRVKAPGDPADLTSSCPRGRTAESPSPGSSRTTAKSPTRRTGSTRQTGSGR